MFLTTDEIRASFNLSQMFKVGDPQIVYASRLAEGDVDDLVSAADFALVKDTEKANVSSGDLTKWTRIRDAHGLLTVAVLYLTITQIRNSGSVTEERDADGNTTNRYMTPQQKAFESAQLVAKAKAMIAQYAPADVASASYRAATSASVRVVSDW
ncbi:MAG TPA: hypothetical protein VGD05_14100 [Pyrinomonadaceae bacterium]|jgi:hypothetical protein